MDFPSAGIKIMLSHKWCFQKPMISKIFASKAVGPPKGGKEECSHGCLWENFELYLCVFLRQESKLCCRTTVFPEPQDLQIIASKAFGPSKGGRRGGCFHGCPWGKFELYASLGRNRTDTVAPLSSQNSIMSKS